MYINDLPLRIKFRVILFADDTVIILKSKNIHNLEPEVNHELEIINNWMKFNQLSLNCSKSSYFIVTPHHKNNKSALNNFSVKIGALKITSSFSTKYLRKIIDNA